MRITFALLVHLMLVACATGGDIPGPLADFGPQPIGYEAAIREHFRPVSSGQEIRFGNPYKAYELQSFLKGGGVAWQGWVVDVQVNKKGLFGRATSTDYHVELIGNVPQDVIEISYPDSLYRLDF